MEEEVDPKAMIAVEIERSGNRRCAECYTPNPNSVSLNFGVFVCHKCAKCHKKLKLDQNNIVNTRSHEWTPEQVVFVRNRGNLVVNEKFEKYLPKYYHRPDEDDPPVIREQWVKAKYEREEFRDLAKQDGYNQGSKIGSLFKRGKDNEKFLRRKFHLKEPDGVLDYYVKYRDKSPKDSIIVRNLVNVYMVPEKVGNPNGMQITYENNGVRRNLFVFGDDAKVSTDWYHALRASMVKHKYQNFPDEQMKRYLNAKILREGWMSKTGPKGQEKFRKRWFSLVGTMIWYYAQPLDAHPLGYISLGSRTFGYGVMKGFPQGTRTDGYGLTVHTPDRVYALSCNTLESRDKWVGFITTILDTCTTVWSQPTIGRLGSQYVDKSTTNSLDSNCSSWSPSNKLSETDSDASSLKESVDSNSPSTRKPLFEKKTRPNKASPAKCEKKGSQKRTSTTKKIAPPGKQNDFTLENVNENPQDIFSSVIKSPSKKYSDDSDDPYDDLQNHNFSSSTSDDVSDDDVVIVLPNSTASEHYHTSSSPSPESNIKQSRRHQHRGEQVIQYENVTITREELPSKSDHSLADLAKPPAKPPRLRAKEQSSDGGSSEVVAANEGTDIKNPQPTEEQKTPTTADPFLPPSENNGNDTTAANRPPSGPLENDFSDSSDFESVRPPSLLKIDDESEEWRKTTFNSLRRIEGQERISLRKTTIVRHPSMSSVTSSVLSDTKEIKPRPIDVTLNNQMNESFWFMAFQTEVNVDDVESYVTPWVGAQIAEAPASVGPFRLPHEFEIAVIDTAPGGFGILRTTGPFYAEYGDVWEVEIANDDGTSPEMFYHEGMETEDQSIMVYANISNVKNFEIALFKDGRKLLSRKNIKPGDAVSLNIKPALYFLAVDQDTYFDLEGQDLRANEFIPTANCIDITYKSSKIKLQTKKRGDTVFFTRMNAQNYQNNRMNTSFRKY